MNDLSLLVIIQTDLNTARGRLNFQAADPDQIFWRRLIGESEIETIISADIWISDTEASCVDLKCYQCLLTDQLHAERGTPHA